MKEVNCPYDKIRVYMLEEPHRTPKYCRTKYFYIGLCVYDFFWCNARSKKHERMSHLSYLVEM